MTSLLRQLLLLGFAAFYLHAEDSLVTVTDLTWHDAKRDRAVPVRIYSPKTVGGPLPVIIFSHGLGGSREGYSSLGQYWAGHGYISVHVQHPGSDSAILREGQPMQAAKRALANPDNLVNRPKDISFAIDQLTALNASDEKWRGRFDVERIGVAGHSFGAYTTMVIAGEKLRSISLADPRVKAVVAMSTPAPGVTGPNAASYASVRIPALHFTGTEDVSRILGTTDSAAKRRIPFDESPGPDTYLVIFKGGDHMMFSGRQRTAYSGPGHKNDDRFRELVCEGSTAFWNAYLKGDAAARQWLAQGGFKQALGDKATFEMK